MFPNFKGFTIVSDNRYRSMLANLEKRFIKRPIDVFFDMEKAFEWAETILVAEEETTS